MVFFYSKNIFKKIINDHNDNNNNNNNKNNKNITNDYKLGFRATTRPMFLGLDSLCDDNNNHNNNDKKLV